MNLISRVKSAYRGFSVGTTPKEAAEELSSYNSPYYSKSQAAPYNPDTLYEKKGSLDVYQNMLIDDQVKACLTMKKLALFASGWEIEPASEDRADIEVADFIRYCLTDGMTGQSNKVSESITKTEGFNKVLENIMSAMEYGFSVSEKIYTMFDKVYFGKYGLKTIKTRPPHSWEFDTDAKGNLKQLVQHTTDGDKYFVPQTIADYFIIYSYNSEFGNWYGNSDLRSAYRSWFSKDIIIKFWNIYLERFGMPPVIGEYPRGADKTEQDDLLEIIKNFQSKNAIKLPSGFKLSLLEAVRRGEASYLEAIEKHNVMIARSILLPDLLGYSEIKGGTYNLGKKHFDVFLWVLENKRQEIREEVVTNQIVKPLVDKNFVVEHYPIFKFNPLTAEDKHKLLEIFVSAVEKGVILPTSDDEKHMRQALQFPAPQAPATAKTKLAEHSDRKFRRKLTKYEEKVNFGEVAKRLDELQGGAIDKTGKIIDQIKDDLISTVFQRKIVEEKKFKDVEKINLKYLGDFRLLWKDELRRSFQVGRKQVKSEITKKKYAEVTVGNLPPKEALEFFERKAFWITGIEKDRILKETKAILYGGIERGETNAQVMFRLEEFFEQYKVVDEITGGHLETMVRTNTMDAYNQGRLTMFQDESVRDFVVAYQYSSIIDDRTTEFCERQDGRIYKANDPIWADITPPNHFNCRATLVPVLGDEEHDIDKHLAVKPDKGFGG